MKITPASHSLARYTDFCHCTHLCRLLPRAAALVYAILILAKVRAAAKLKTTTVSKLPKKLQCIISFPDENDMQDSSNCSIQDMVVYYPCGYIHRKMEKVTCKDCQAFLTSTPEEYAATSKPHKRALAPMRPFEEGCLHHLSQSLQQ